MCVHLVLDEEELGDLDGVERGALEQLISRDEHVDAVTALPWREIQARGRWAVCDARCEVRGAGMGCRRGMQAWDAWQEPAQ